MCNEKNSVHTSLITSVFLKTHIHLYIHREFDVTIIKFSEKSVKVALSPFDDKRFVLENGRDTRAHGHYKNDKIV